MSAIAANNQSRNDSRTGTEQEGHAIEELDLLKSLAKANSKLTNSGTSPQLFATVIEFNILYRKKGIHPGKSYVFYGNILVSDLPGVLAQIKNSIHRDTAFTRHGKPLPGYAAVFKPKEVV